ncbi:MAG TPA: hypothetical protein VFP84_41020 [Kofleriaceae bacterium]|nr:hypothetical protein [Kofleriaceae bacterium]
MGDHEPGKAAVELPLAWSPWRRPRHRHRGSTGLSGALLFACMFLPALKGCDHAVRPLDMPVALPPYVYGLVFAGLALAYSPRALAWAALVLRVLALGVVIGAGFVFLEAPPVGVVGLIVGGVLLAIIRLAGTSETRVATTGAAAAAMSALWFGLLALTPDALIGVYLGLAGALGLLASCLMWLRELASAPRALGGDIFARDESFARRRDRVLVRRL